ncbi:MAG: 50S ribosomal protein L18 [Candidatus Buchananbacteria bacterium CG10_big_fil_rev_8_21_14_0_10_42_9]|uniref:Large ribosomal subunit protein uL18 n=1 Tax=Candidatus Buchananbacteria bacterium CG10_big_fil_rev_8_21_14_0_10_42_9 TaxID=1974526 RepID=A0A2H0W238_9BACT|nr:MAG: 50S ribosomal protein L18 [Candidatus Buchananbacteria bacterium CG10_big_fil_rev_8_21_14_0_10_42_9]
MKEGSTNKLSRAKRRQIRVRTKISGTSFRPRLSVSRSARHISAQLIDDTVGKTLVFANDKEVKGEGTKSEKAKNVGQLLAQKAIQKKISQVVFDRRSYLYHGRIKALADGAREGGLKF